MSRTSILSDADVRAFLSDLAAAPGSTKVAFTIPGMDAVGGALKGVGDELGAYRDPLLGGLAGAAVGGAGLGLATGRRSGETDDELSRRRWGNVATGALAGGAAGVGGGALLDAGGGDKPGLLSRVMGNTTKVVGGGAAGAAGTAAVAGSAAMGVNKLHPGALNDPVPDAIATTQGVADDLAKTRPTVPSIDPATGAVKMIPKLDAKGNQVMINRIDPSTGQPVQIGTNSKTNQPIYEQVPHPDVEAPGVVNPELLSSQDRLVRLKKLLNAKNTAGERVPTYGSAENYKQEFDNLHVERMGRLGKILRVAGIAGAVGGAGLGAYNAATPNN